MNEPATPDNNNMEKSKKKKPAYPEKEFKARNSIITDLMENDRHFRLVYSIFLVALLMLFTRTVVQEYLIYGRINLGQKTFMTAFQHWDSMFLSWGIMNAMAWFVYLCFNVWASIRTRLSPKSAAQKSMDIFCIFSIIAYIIATIYLATRMSFDHDLTCVESAFVVLESARIIMKVYAFIRYNTEKVRAHKVHSEQTLTLPTFSYFVFFMFVPTLIYRDQYPRTEQTNWKRVGLILAEIMLMLLSQCWATDVFVLHLFREFGLRKFSKTEVFLTIANSTLLGMFLLITTFYMAFHLIQNLFSELLRFGDREFYKEWWFSASYYEFYRKWNPMVSDWLYFHIYVDVVRYLVPNNKVLAKCLSFLVSALVHEWCLVVGLRFFMPIAFGFFIFFGATLSFIGSKYSPLMNATFLYSIFFGNGMLISVYSMEYFARENTPPNENATGMDYYKPRFLTCDCYF